MSAYVISEVEIVDPQLAERYKVLAAKSIEAYGGQYLIRGASPNAIEGVWEANSRLVIVEFPDLSTAKRWYDSNVYAEARQLSRAALRRRLLFVEGQG